MSFYPAFWEPACHAGIPSLVNKTARIHKEHKSQTNRKLVSVLNPTCVRPSKQANMHNSFIILYTLKKTCWSHSFAEPSHAGSKLWRIKLPRSTWPPNKHTLLCCGLLRPTEFVSYGATSHPTSNGLPLGFLPKQWPERRDESSRFATAIHEPHGHGLRSRAPRRRLPFSPGTPRHRWE
jgi:hypothetical protein